jgi:glycosyltransferase involved in cell wall biosynthesis
MGPRPRQSIRPFAIDRGAPPMDHPQDTGSGATASVKISVVTSVYNRVGTIGETVASVRRQTHAAVEHIVQDGGSRDGTRDVLARLAAPGMQVESAPDRGIYDGINRGIARATGEVVGLMHSDDLFAADDILARVAETFATREVDGVYGDLVYVSAADPGRVIRYWTSGPYHQDRLRRGWMPPHPTLYLRREVFARWGSYDTDFRIAADYEAMLRWLVKGRIRLAYIPIVMVRMRVGGESNRSIGRILRKSAEDYRALRRHGVGGLGTLAAKNFGKLGQFIRKDTAGS